jgi:hypothetical protein
LPRSMEWSTSVARWRQAPPDRHGSGHRCRGRDLIPLSKHIIVFKGDFVKKASNSRKDLSFRMRFLMSADHRNCRASAQRSPGGHRLQGVEINDKHIEIIVRQMLRKVKITDPGDTSSSGEIRWTVSNSPPKTSASSKRVASPPTPALCRASPRPH